MINTPLSILKKYGIRPAKKLGQSFLIDINIIERIVSASQVTKDDSIVEIGAGIGVMTFLLTEKAKRVIAVEVDPKMIDILNQELKWASNLEIINKDVLKYDFSSAFKIHDDETGSQRIKIVGNIPYNISSQILFHLLNFRDCISSMVIMFQKEVAERIIASPGTKAYGILSVISKMYTIPSRVINVPGNCFYPKPKVDSTVLKFDVRQSPLYQVKSHDCFLKVVKTSFSKRRKTLLNNLKGSEILPFNNFDVSAVLDSLEIDGKRRGETLTVEEFGKLSNAIYMTQIS